MECSHGSTCTRCNPNGNYYVVDGACQVCPISDAKFLSYSTSSGQCLDCWEYCLTCEGTSDNCLTFKPSNCGKNCLFCQGTTSYECQRCRPGYCQSIKGDCINCPPEVYQVQDSNSIVANSQMTFSVVQLTFNNQKEYKLTFSEQDIVFLGFYLYDLKKHIKVNLIHFLLFIIISSLKNSSFFMFFRLKSKMKKKMSPTQQK